jgi:hypothetical protein
MVTTTRRMGVMLCDQRLGQLLKLESAKTQDDKTGYTHG